MLPLAGRFRLASAAFVDQLLEDFQPHGVAVRSPDPERPLYRSSSSGGSKFINGAAACNLWYSQVSRNRGAVATARGLG
jgi:hypothetical protein